MTRLEQIRRRRVPSGDEWDYGLAVKQMSEDIAYLIALADAARAHYEAIRGTMAASGKTGKRLGEMLGEGE